MSEDNCGWFAVSLKAQWNCQKILFQFWVTEGQPQVWATDKAAGWVKHAPLACVWAYPGGSAMQRHTLNLEALWCGDATLLNIMLVVHSGLDVNCWSFYIAFELGTDIIVDMGLTHFPLKWEVRCFPLFLCIRAYTASPGSWFSSLSLLPLPALHAIFSYQLPFQLKKNPETAVSS